MVFKRTRTTTREFWCYFFSITEFRKQMIEHSNQKLIDNAKGYETFAALAADSPKGRSNRLFGQCYWSVLPYTSS